MRWSYDQPNAFEDFEAFTEVEILLDGNPVRGVRAFDTDDGWVRILVLDAEGHPQLSDDGQDPMERTLLGKVELRPTTSRAKRYVVQRGGEAA